MKRHNSYEVVNEFKRDANKGMDEFNFLVFPVINIFTVKKENKNDKMKKLSNKYFVLFECFRKY